VSSPTACAAAFISCNASIFSLAQRAYIAAPDARPSGPRIDPPNANPVNPAQPVKRLFPSLNAHSSLHPTFNRPVLASTRLTRILLILPIFSCSRASHGRVHTTYLLTTRRPTATLAPSRHLEPSDICANPRRTAEDSLRLKRPRGKPKIAASVYRPHVSADRCVLMWTTPHSLAVQDRLTRNHIEAESRSHGNLAFTPSHPHTDTPLTLTSVSTLVTNSLYFFRIIHRIYFHDTEHSSLGFFGPSESPSLTRAIRS
jgi:hypothetical protein